MRASDLDEIAVTERFRSGDVAAFDWLVKRYRVRANGIARRVVRSFADAEDLAQDGFVRAWSSREQLLPGSRVGPWLLQIVRNLALDLVRRRRTITYEPLRLTHVAPRIEAPDTQATARLLSVRIRRSIDRLPPSQRRVASLFLEQGLRHAEIAKLTSLTEATVRSHLAIARRRLRVALADWR